MKKLLFVLISYSLLLSGCTKKDDTTKALNALYEGYYEAVSSSEYFITQSDYYTLSGEIVAVQDGTYRYSIILDNPQIAMYDVVMMGVENNIEYSEAKKMMPSIGLLSDKYSLIPFQSNSEKNYVKGLVISGESKKVSVQLKLLVEWSNRLRDKQYREFFDITLDESGISFNSNVESNE